MVVKGGGAEEREDTLAFTSLVAGAGERAYAADDKDEDDDDDDNDAVEDPLLPEVMRSSCGRALALARGLGGFAVIRGYQCHALLRLV